MQTSVRRFRRYLGYALILPVVIAMAAVPCSEVWAHDDDHDHEHRTGTHGTETHGEASANPDSIGSALILPSIEGPKPWSDKPVLEDPSRFSIAIMTDRTGGHRPGIWMKAVERLNWLRPEFVVSVGDLIEGYTQDDQEIDRQWKEFLGFIDQMNMKFFFVAGNHDVTNPKLHRIWRNKFGREWYSFDYHGVHFVCLSSEDPSAQLGEEQLAWLEQDLQGSANARWTLVFLHKPLWTYAERELSAGNPDPTNWKRVEKMLVDRPHTVFAGHVHHYVQYQRNGQQYYSLATTGGGSRLRGLDYGEFDHVTWLTMEQDGPRVVNLLLDGIQPADVVTEGSIANFRKFLADVQIEIEPIFISSDAIQRGEIQLSVANKFDRAIKLEGEINGLPLVGLSMESQSLALEVDAGAAVTQVVPFEMGTPVSLNRFRQTTMTATVSTKGPNSLKAEWTVPVIVDREYEIRERSITLDGALQEWEDAKWWQTPAEPTLAGTVANWNGAEDSSFSLAAGYDDQSLSFAVRVQDEQVMAGDAITVMVDPRPLVSRLARNGLGNETIALTVQAPESDELAACTVQRFGRARANEQFLAFGRRVAGGYEVEIQVPIRNVVRAQGESWSSVQVGARLADIDADGETPVEVLWRASPNRFENRNFAHLIRK